jgi:hypothetical protein
MIEEKSLLFFEKKRSKKNFDTGPVWGYAGATQARSGAKVFWFFFSKKNCFLASRYVP